jgi:hypothetical protein
MITIPIRRGAERIAVEIDGRHADREFGGIPLSMIGSINLGPFAPSVPATMPDRKQPERSQK